MAGATHSIRRRLTAMMMLTSAASIGLASVAFITYEFFTARSETRRQIGTLTRIVAASSTAALAFRAEDDAREALAVLRTEPQVLAAALYDEEGRLFATYPGDAPHSSFPARPAAAGLQFHDDRLEGFQTVSETPERPLGALFIRADMQPMYRRFLLYGASAALVTLGSLLLAYALSRLLQRQISRPLLALADTARAVAERGDYSVRAQPSAEAELGVLTNAFNHMLGRIDAQNSALRENEMRLRAVLNSTLIAVIIMDMRGRIVDWNKRAEEIFGWSRAEAIGGALAEMIIPERLREAHRRGLERYLATGVGEMPDRQLDTSALRRDGVEFPVELSISVLRNHAEPTFCGFVTDVTERKQARARMQAQLARLDLLQRTTRAIAERQDLNSIYQVILRSLEEDLPVDFGCICRYEGEALTVANIGAADASYAASLEWRIGSPLRADEASLARSLAGALAYEPDAGGAAPLPLAQALSTAGLRSFVIAPLIVESNIFGVLLVARRRADAFSSGECEFLRQLSEHVALAARQVQLHTELQHAYDELRQSQQVILQQERLRALGQMASGVAHDINNAVSPIALYTESLLEREPALSERAREYLRIIQRAIEDVSQTVAKMREFYRPRDAAVDLQAIDLNPLVTQAVQATRARWSDIPQERGVVISVRTELDPDAPRVLGAASDIRDALTNLIFNAVDAMPTGGELIVRTRGSAGADAGTLVDLEVADSGVGMDEQTRSRCLEPFFTTKGERGTGMGLAMVYGMARRHGAQLEIDSAPGAGTTVRLRFRTPAVNGEARHVPPPEPASLPPLRILVVDDDPVVLDSLVRTLAAEGHAVEAADDGQRGIERFAAAQRASKPFDLVVTDLGMPFVDGRAVAAAVKRAAPQTPVLLLTGWGERLRAEQTTPPNIDRVLSKPPKLAELRRAFAELTAIATAARD